jgi:hypothetical protein
VGEYPFDIVYCDILCIAPTHDYVKGKADYDKLIVFVDSLTRWIEAHPVNGDPSADDVLDISQRWWSAATVCLANYVLTPARI